MALNRKLTREEKAIREQQAELQRQLEAVQSEAKGQEAALQTAAKVAGLSAYRVVDALYDLLEVVPETPTTRSGKNGTVEVPVDKTEEVRTERLLTMLETVIESADPELLSRLQCEDREGVEMRHLEREERREQRGRGKTTTPTPIQNVQKPLAASQDDDEDEDQTPQWAQTAP
ncbi:hypothetical protein DEO23_15670 [Brachybacterium endophyticum]|uniref:Uncharacterized protein n=1 Tax=Brachybacterium endophyticum TaxID=2182385 RepID=A0A2U2RGH4_9MICO|nr:hypothetical protein [Brachybacterium endophyticum]PWH04969.1 hypothetical protein DEO23_15670 [Brachybacterium endophyticum]